ncbi:MAG: hypothetical protein GC196_10515 [Hyphomonas sp.]|nr:hypothetical protein [Hyphomonas sp.]
MTKVKSFFIYAGAALGLMAIGLVTLSALGVRVLPHSQYDRCVQLCPYPKAPPQTGRAGEDFDAMANHAAETLVAVECLEDCAQKFKKHRRQKAADGGASPIPATEESKVANAAAPATEVPKVADASAWAKYFPWPSAAPEVVKTGSGLEYVVLASGDPAGASPENGQFVRVHYEGRLADTGALFDSSFERGEPAELPSDGLIEGLVETLALMKSGDRWMVYVPSDLAYGAEGTPGGPIPPNAPIQIEVALISVPPATPSAQTPSSYSGGACQASAQADLESCLYGPESTWGRCRTDYLDALDRC